MRPDRRRAAAILVLALLAPATVLVLIPLAKASTTTPSILAVQATVNVGSGNAPLVVTLSSVVTGGTPPYTLNWQFGDGGSSSATSLTHTFNVVGPVYNPPNSAPIPKTWSTVYGVVLTARDSAGSAAASYLQIRVMNPSGGSGPLITGSTPMTASPELPFTLAGSGFGTPKLEGGGGFYDSMDYDCGIPNASLVVHDSRGTDSGWDTCTGTNDDWNKIAFSPWNNNDITMTGFGGWGGPPPVGTQVTISIFGPNQDGTTTYLTTVVGGAVPMLFTPPSSGTLPLPKIVSAIANPSTITLGQSTVITLTASNAGGPAQWQTVTISFPSNPPVGVISITGSDLGAKRIELTGRNWYACYSRCNVTLSYPLVEGESDNWVSGQSHTISIGITPMSAGTFTYYYKTVAAGSNGSPNYPATSWDPTSGTLDQQNEYVYVGTITVLPPKTINHITISPNPASAFSFGSIQFSATAYDASGNAIPGVQFEWSTTVQSSSIGPSGLLTQNGCFGGGFFPCQGVFLKGVSASSEGVVGYADVDLIANGNSLPPWTGYIAHDSASPFTSVQGDWIEPTISSVGQSGTWIGIGGTNGANLIQTGVGENCVPLVSPYTSGSIITRPEVSCSYWGFAEVLPSGLFSYYIALGKTVKPGDSMSASIVEVSSDPGNWQVTLTDSTQGWTYVWPGPLFAHIFPPDRTTAEWIHEVNVLWSPFADFAPITFTNADVTTGGVLNPIGKAGAPGEVSLDVSALSGSPGSAVSLLSDYDSFTITENGASQAAWASGAVFSLGSPANMELVDQSSHVLEYNSSIGSVTNSIPNAFFFATGSTQNVVVFRPNGTYTVRLKGTGEGEYHFGEFVWDNKTLLSKDSVNATIHTGDTLQTKVTITARGNGTVVGPISPFQNTAATTYSTSTVPTSSTTKSTSTGGGAIPEFAYQLISLSVFTLLVVASYLFVRNRRPVG